MIRRPPDRERKRMARLLIEDVTLLKADNVTLQIRFRGGATRTLIVPLPEPVWISRRTSSDVVTAIDHLLDEHTEGEIAKLLNDRGLMSGTGKPFHREVIAKIRRAYTLTDRYARLRARGLLELHEIAKQLHVDWSTIKVWRNAGLLTAHRYNDRGECLYEQPGANAPVKYKHQHKTRGQYAHPPSTSARSSR
jgi:hypothetical protein